MISIIGNGMIAASCKRSLDCDLPMTIFASGVSNTTASEPGQCSREKILLEETLNRMDARHTFIYFGTCSLYDPAENASDYCAHKLKMEEIIQGNCDRSLILRLPQVVGRNGNPNNLINFLRTHICNQTNFPLWKNAHRTLLAVDDVSLAIKQLPIEKLDAHSVINMAPCQPVPITKIVGILEDILKRKANYQPVDKGIYYQIDVTLFERFLSSTFPVRGEAYLRDTLRTYLTT